MKTLTFFFFVVVTFLFLATSNCLFANRDSVKVIISVKSIEGNIKSGTANIPEKLTLKDALNADDLAASDFHFTFKGASSGSVELISYSYPNDLWQKLEYSLLDVSFTIDANFVQELNDDILAFNIVRKTGTAHFVGKATQKDFGITYEYNFDRSQQFDLENVEGTLQYSISKKKITKLYFALVNSTNYPYAKSIQYENDILNVIYVMPPGEGWWFTNPDDIYQVPNPAFDLGNQFPTASYTFNPLSPNTDDTVTFDASTSGDPDGGNPVMLAAQWDFGDGTTGNGKITSHTYSTPGEYNVCLTIIDVHNLRNKICNKINIIQGPQPPHALFSYKPENPILDEAITFDASGSFDPDGEIISYKWDFGNGISSSEKIVKIKYNEIASYTVNLIVEDNTGLQDKTVRIINLVGNKVTLFGKLNNVSLENSGYLNYVQPLGNATVDLYENNNLIASTLTSSTGEFKFEQLNESQKYELHISATGLVKSSNKIISIKKIKSIILPVEKPIYYLPLELNLQKYNLIFDLEHLATSSNFFEFNLGIPLIKCYDESAVVALLMNWNKNQTPEEIKKIQSISRLIIADQVLESLYRDAALTTRGMSQGIYNLVYGFWGFRALFNTSPTFLNSYIQALFFYYFIESSMNFVQSVFPQIGEQYPNLITVALDIFLEKSKGEDLRKILIDKTLEHVITGTIDNIYLSTVYVPSTQTSLDIAVQKAANFDFNENDDLSKLFKSSHEMISISSKTTKEKMEVINNTQSAGDISENIALAFGMASSGGGFFTFSIAAILFQQLSIIANGLTIINSGFWLNSLMNYGVPQGINRAFNSSQENIKSLNLSQFVLDGNKESKLFSPDVFASLITNLEESQKDYFSILEKLLSDIKEGNPEKAMTKIPELVLKDQQLMEAQLIAQGPIISTADKAYVTVESFNEQFQLLNESISGTIAERIKFYLQLSSLSEINVQFTDSLSIQAEKVKSSIINLGTLISETVNLVKDIEAPPVVLVERHSIDSSFVKPGIAFELRAAIQNVGALSADSVIIELNTDSITSILSKKKVIITNLDVNESYHLLWTLQVNDTTRQSGTYIIKVNVPDGKGLSTNGFYSIRTEGVATVNENNFSKLIEHTLYQNYPNPFKDFTTFSYHLSKRSNVTLCILDFNGKQIKTLVNTNQNAGNYSVDWDGKDQFGFKLVNGIYFYRLITDNDTQSKKMLILK